MPCWVALGKRLATLVLGFPTCRWGLHWWLWCIQQAMVWGHSQGCQDTPIMLCSREQPALPDRLA